MIVRGATNVPLTIGGFTLPTNARMNLYVVNQQFQPLDFVTIANIPSGPGSLCVIDITHKDTDWSAL